MEFLRPLQRRLAIEGGRHGLRSLNNTQNTWSTLRTWNLQQSASLHRSSYAYRVSNFVWRTTGFKRNRNVRWQSSKPPSPNPTEHLGSPEPQSLSARMRKLSREYGWSALGVYLGLSALDFPFCFLGVRWLGTERIGRWEAKVVETFWNGLESVYPDARRAINDKMRDTGMADGDREGSGWGVEEASARNQSDSASLWTQLALAYAIHKSFIFIRVPLTAAITPKVVKTLRSWGWNIGKRKPKS